MGIRSFKILFLVIFGLGSVWVPLVRCARPVLAEADPTQAAPPSDNASIDDSNQEGSSEYSQPSTARSDAAIPFALPPLTELSRVKSALIKTDQGEIVVELFPDDAPWHVANFKYLADRKFYEGKSFDVVTQDYIVQGGRPTKAEEKLYAYTLPPEFSNRTHTAGTLGMARVPDQLRNLSRRSSSTQFHFLLQEDRRMDGSYTAFGRVLRGISILSKIRAGTRIQSVQVFVQ